MRFKRFISIIICISLIFSLAMNTFAESKVKKHKIKYDGKIYEYSRFPDIYINGKKVKNGEMPAVITDKSRTLVPVREVFESLGAVVKWDNKNKQVFILMDNMFVVFTIDSSIALVNGKKIKLDETAKLITNLDVTPITGKTMVPLRFVLETFNFDLLWDAEKYNIYAFSKDKDNDSNSSDDKNNDSSKDSDKKSNDDKNKDNEQKNNESPIDNEIKKLPTDIAENPIIWKTSNDELLKFVDSMDKNKLDVKNYPVVNIKGAEYKETEDGQKQFIIKSSGKISSIKHVIWHKKLIVDIINANKDFAAEKINLNDNDFVDTIRASQYDNNPKITRIVFDLCSGTLNYNIKFSDDRKNIIINVQENFIHNISLMQNQKGDYISISGMFNPSVNVFRLTNPERLVIDMPYAKTSLKQEKDNVDGQYVSKMRTSQFDDNTVRVVLELKGQAYYDIISEGSAKTIIQLTKPTYKNILYENKDKPKIILKKNKNQLIDIKNIVVKNNYLTKNCKVTLPEGDYKEFYGYGDMVIKDGSFEQLSFKNEGTKKYQIELTSNHIYEYTVTEDEQNIYINAVKPKEVYDKIVVIDPGHGGKDPGKPAGIGNYTGMDEKELNIKIALKLYDLLEKDKNIKVYMTRFDDTYPTLQDRCDIANDVGADLFISVHNNAFFKSYTGTETLYFNLNKKNKEIATILNKNLINEIKINNRGLRNRTNLYVLKHTKMPAAIMEVAYMTNPSDAKKLKDDNFRKRAAQGIYNGIVEAINYIKSSK